MIKEVAASQAAKALALCVCPVIGAGIALKVPAARDAIHRATAPDKPKPKRSRIVRKTPAQNLAEKGVCPEPTPVRLTGNEITIAPPMELGGVTLLPDLAPADLAIETIRSAALRDPVARVPGLGGGGFIRNPAGIPEPAIWMQAIAGFAIAGTTLRFSIRQAEPEAIPDAG